MARTLAIAVLGAFALIAVDGGSASAGNKCAGSKIKAAAKKANCLLGLESKEAKSGDPKDPAKVTSCGSKMVTSFDKAEAKPPCLTTGDSGAIETKVDAFVTDVDTELSIGIPNACQSSKLKAAGKKAKCLLGLRAKLASNDTPLDPAKVQKCIDKFTQAFSKAEAKPPCNTTGDAGAIEAKVDAFVDDVAPELNPAPTTTTTSPPTTTTTLPICGDGLVTGSEQCDPPCGTGQCPGGSICNSTCQCEVAAACACGAPTPTSLTFLTTTPGGTPSGSIAPAKCVGGSTPGADCVTDANCPGSGTCRGALQRGGLYFGGGSVGIPLPATIPDNGKSIMKACCNGTSLTLAPTTAADTGSVNTCTGVGCNFGPPLPIKNPNVPGLSTCVLNQVSRNAVGSAQCTTGVAAIDLPLGSQIVLGGDMLPNRCVGTTDPNNVGRACAINSDCPGGTCNSDLAGIQACPICNPTTLKCNGGANDPIGGAAVACTPGTLTTPGVEYPTSRDCPPSVPVLATLPIGFALTTGSVTKTSVNLPGQPRVFCGFCYDPDLATFSNPAVSCTGDGDCAGQGGFIQCRQSNSGAFGNFQATTITETGSPAGSLVDHAAHASMLVSVFCIPPTYSIVDGSAGLPGPGAASLPGTIQVQ
jgi:hypothetical protein